VLETKVPDLLQGKLDLTVTTRPRRREDIDCEHIWVVGLSVCRAPGHELHDAENPLRDEILEHEFVGIACSAGSPDRDGWPLHVERTVAAFVADFRAMAELGHSGAYLVVLPTKLVETEEPYSRFRRLPAMGLEPLHVVVERRKMLLSTRRWVPSSTRCAERSRESANCPEPWGNRSW